MTDEDLREENRLLREKLGLLSKAVDEAVVEINKITAEVRARNTVVDEEVARLKEAIISAAHEISDWGAYADDYFQKKHDLAGTVQKYLDIAQN